MKRVYVFLAQGFEEMEALGPVDILRRGGVEVLTVSITDCYEVVGAHGVRVMADRLLGEIDAEGADLLLLPGGMPGATNLLDCRPLHRLLTTHHQNGKLLGAICAAPMVLGQLGLPHDDFRFSRDVLSQNYTHPSAVHAWSEGIYFMDETGITVLNLLTRPVSTFRESPHPSPRRSQAAKVFLQTAYDALGEL